MPREGQKSITIPKWVWERATEYFKTHEEILKDENINSVTQLIVRWILKESKENT